MLTELDKYKLWAKRMDKIGPAITTIAIIGFLLAIYLMMVVYA